MNENHQHPDPHEIVKFWQSAGPSAWFKKDEVFDKYICQNYKSTPKLALSGQLDDWVEQSTSSLALILILDQFPRNLYRNSAQAYQYDEKARVIAHQAIEKGHDDTFVMPLKRFFYLPFMHSERLEDQHFCIDLCKKSDDQEGVEFGEIHLNIIKKYGRFPHRNEVLGRKSTNEEIEFLNSGGFKG